MMEAPIQQSLISATAGLVGAWLGSWLALRNQKVDRKQKFIREQLSEFYAPMLAYRDRILASKKSRANIYAVAREEWGRIVKRTEGLPIGDADESQERRWPDYRRILQYDHEQLKILNFPMHRQMLDLFTSKMHLAELSTRKHLPALVEFLDVWDRIFTENLPAEVMCKMEPTDENLKALFADLHDNFTRLQSALKE